MRSVSIHAFRGEGDQGLERSNLRPRVSIHAFRGEGDQGLERSNLRPRGFNPRLPGGRRPAVDRIINAGAPVSIHAFRGEGDQRLDQTARVLDVSIHAFRGEGDCPFRKRCEPLDSFNPRLPGGRRLRSYRIVIK